jgi:hypothetical protein
MGFFSKLADGIIQTVGITAPTPAQRKQTILLLGGLVLTIALLFVAGAAVLMVHFIG